MNNAVQVRWATVDDAERIALVHVETWRAAYRGLIDDVVLDQLDVDARTQAWSERIANFPAGVPTAHDFGLTHRVLVAEVDNQVWGWASFGAGRDEGDADHGELSGLYVHPSQWSQRLGHALIERVEQELRDSQFSEAYLWVLFGNERAIRFYERHGWHADGTEKVGAAGGASGLRELRHVRRLDEVTQPRR